MNTVDCLISESFRCRRRPIRVLPFADEYLLEKGIRAGTTYARTAWAGTTFELNGGDTVSQAAARTDASSSAVSSAVGIWRFTPS